jgi:surface polysaccharide O-acyltransferase-like enzyme
MAPKSRFVDDLLRVASASRSRSAVTLAAVSFAICHFVVMRTVTANAATADLDAEIPLQLIHFAAVVCRFALPLGFMVVGFATHAKEKEAGAGGARGTRNGQ